MIHGDDEENPFVPVEVTEKAKEYYNWINDNIWNLNRLQKEPEVIELMWYYSREDQKVTIVTRQGKCISFSEEDVRPMGRNASGVLAINLGKNDEVVSMELAEKKEELLVVTKNGFGKRTPVREYKIQARGGKGLLTSDKSKFDKTGELVGAMAVADDDEVFLINSDGIIIRIKANEVSKLGRTTQGVKIMKVEEGTEIVAMAKGPRDDAEDEDVPAEKETKRSSKTDDGDQMSLV